MSEDNRQAATPEEEHRQKALVIQREGIGFGLDQPMAHAALPWGLRDECEGDGR